MSMQAGYGSIEEVPNEETAAANLPVKSKWGGLRTIALLFLGCVAVGVAGARAWMGRWFWESRFEVGGITRDLLWYSIAAYCEEYEGRSWSGPTSGFEVSKTIYSKELDVKGYVGYKLGLGIVVAFRGTASFDNWITDFKYAQAPVAYEGCEGCLVHEGFYKCAQAVVADVWEEIRRIRTKMPITALSHVYVTGHSLGGAISTLVSLELADHMRVVNYSFGSPRIGNDDFAAYTASTLPSAVRVVHQADLIPHMPLRAWGYKHHPTEMWETEDPDGGIHIRECDGSGEDPSCSASYPWFHCSLGDHARYLGLEISCDSVQPNK
ncbi:unnamed protein product [Chrysoparadoxa australica]